MAMPFDPETHHRRSIRIAGYDYTQCGAYFVTICSHGREELFGEVIDGHMQVNAFGCIVAREWLRTAEIRQYVQLHTDEFVVMPNHVHGIIWIVDDADDAGTRSDTGARYHVGARRRRAPTTQTTEHFGKPVSGSIPTIIRAFKSATTKRINTMRGTPSAPVWQRNYYEHIIRTEDTLDTIRAYIQTNPQSWAQDSLNSQRGGPAR
jgi:REP element-mobilizing transposase RayT